MSKLYNPELVPKEEIKRTFVGRHKLVEEIVSIVEHQPDGAGVQHLIIVAPRGMGKTTLLLMVRFAVEDGDLSKTWQPVQFPEESYDIYELSDFWIKIAEYLAADTGDENLFAKIAEIKNKFTKNEDLYEVAYALVKDWRRKNGKRIVLLIDNFDMILQQINSEQDAARLRKVMMNEDTVMLIGSAVTFFQEVRGYEHPLYNFFKIYNLEGFKDELIEEFLRVRAEEAGIKDFEKLMRENRPRIRTLSYFTDGNPRLVLMLFDVVTNSKISDVEKALEKLLDEITPYLKSKIELLPPQQRKILDYIARMSFEKREGVTPGAISAEVRLAANQTSAQLKRLAEDGYVRSANVSGRSSFYVLSEPLIAIWYQMRFGRTAFQKRRWLIFVLESLYELEEFRNEQTRLRRQYQKALNAGENARANDILRHQLYLAEAMPEFSGAKPHFEHFVAQSMILKNDYLKEELKNPDLLKKLSNDLLDQLQTEGYITENQCAKAKTDSAAYELSEKEHDLIVELLAGQKILEELTPESRTKQLQTALEHFNRALELNPQNLSALRARSFFFYSFCKYREAILDINNEIEIYEKLLSHEKRQELANNLAMAYMNKGVVLRILSRLNEAVSEYDKAIVIFENLINEQNRQELVNDLAMAYMNKGNTLDSLGRSNEAISEYDKAIAIRENLINHEKRHELANDLAMAYINKGVALNNLGRLNEAVDKYNKAIELFNDLEQINQNWEIPVNRAKTLLNKSILFVKQKKFSQAGDLIKETVELFEKIKFKELDSLIINLLFSAAEGDDYSNIRKLLQGEEMEKRFFPVLRAIDYLETGNEDLIEKLSPEVRGVVEEAVRALRHTSEIEEEFEPVKRAKKRKK